MEFKHSDAVDPDLVAASSFSILPVRISRYLETPNVSALNLLEEFNRTGENASIPDSCADPRGHAVSFCIPEAMPERVDLVARLFDFGYLHDGKTQAVPSVLSSNGQGIERSNNKLNILRCG